MLAPCAGQNHLIPFIVPEYFGFQYDRRYRLKLIQHHPHDQIVRRQKCEGDQKFMDAWVPFAQTVCVCCVAHYTLRCYRVEVALG